MTHICVGKLTIIGSYNGLSPGRRRAIIWNNAGILLIGRLGTNFNEILIGIHTFSFKKMHSKMSSVKWRPFCLGLNVLKISCMARVKFQYSPPVWQKLWSNGAGHGDYSFNFAPFCSLKQQKVSSPVQEINHQLRRTYGLGRVNQALRCNCKITWSKLTNRKGRMNG